MTAAMSEKFEIDLAERPTMVTVRGQCRLKDGQVHTDPKGKLVTVLIYLNNSWESEGGRLRLLRSNANLDDYAVEVPQMRVRCWPSNAPKMPGTATSLTKVSAVPFN